MKPLAQWFLYLGLWSSLIQAASLNNAAPAFTLPNSHHQKKALADYKGKVVFVNFWASWCAPCRSELPALNQLAADYGRKKIRVLAINVDKDSADAKALLKKLELNDPQMEILWDTRSEVVESFNIDVMPSSFILDQVGRIRFMHSGFHSQDPARWHAEIDQLMKRQDSDGKAK